MHVDIQQMKENYKCICICYTIVWSAIRYGITYLFHDRRASCQLETCESEISVRIESGIESATTIRIRIKSGDSRLQIQY